MGRLTNQRDNSNTLGGCTPHETRHQLLPRRDLRSSRQPNAESPRLRGQAHRGNAKAPRGPAPNGRRPGFGDERDSASAFDRTTAAVTLPTHSATPRRYRDDRRGRGRPLRGPGQGARPAGWAGRRPRRPARRHCAANVAPAGVLLGRRRVIQTRLPPRSGCTPVRGSTH
jgi:hypothetical protein